MSPRPVIVHCLERDEVALVERHVDQDVGNREKHRQRPALQEEGRAIANGRYVAFVSAATNLVPGDTNGATDVFVVDRAVPIR